VVPKGLTYVRSNAIGVVALFLAIGGTGYAATGGFSQGGKLTGCANSAGELRLLKSGKHCRRGQKTVTWNATGPQGPRGSQGPAGAPGGPGLSNAYEASRSAGPLIATEGATLETFATLSVPSGSYVASAKATIKYSQKNATAEVVCDLTNDQNLEKDADTITISSGPVVEDANAFTLEASAKLPSGGTWQLRCGSRQAALSLSDIKIQAVQVGAVTRTVLP
jgi:hypothetical protein